MTCLSIRQVFIQIESFGHREFSNFLGIASFTLCAPHILFLPSAQCLVMYFYIFFLDIKIFRVQMQFFFYPQQTSFTFL